MQTVSFQGHALRLIVTDHARARMDLRNVTEKELVDVIETGTVKIKSAGKVWVFKHNARRTDNLIAASIAVESKDLVVITVMVNWEPT